MFGTRHLLNICYHPMTEKRATLMPISLLVKMIEDITRYLANTLRRGHSFICVDSPNLFIFYVILFLHSVNEVYTEGKNISVIDSIHDGICMELVPKCLRGCAHKWITATTCIHSKDRRTCKAEDVIVLKCLDDFLVHITEL